MKPKTLEEELTAFRIGDPAGEFRIYSAAGARRYPGRWNNTSSPVIYASLHYSTAMLEKLAHGNGRLPPNQHYITISIPRGLAYERLDPAGLPGWDTLEPGASRRFGAKWFAAAQSAVLLVPSYVARLEWNAVINPAHPEAGRITHTPPQPVWWDKRLFGG